MSSATGGYLQPLVNSTDDTALADILQAFIVGVTGLAGAYVRPMWQSNMPVIPTNGTNWCAFNLGNFQAIQGYQAMNADNEFNFQQHETFDLSCSFYGSNCQRYAAMIRDGLQLSQNREALWLQGISVSGGVQIVHVPELINDVWHDRCDIAISMGRVITREYDILNFAGAAGTIETDAPEISEEWTAGAVYSTGVFDYTFDETFA
jgi:hypothetical protein